MCHLAMTSESWIQKLGFRIMKSRKSAFFAYFDYGKSDEMCHLDSCFFLFLKMWKWNSDSAFRILTSDSEASGSQTSTSFDISFFFNSDRSLHLRFFYHTVLLWPSPSETSNIQMNNLLYYFVCLGFKHSFFLFKKNFNDITFLRNNK